jgi:hypothetical protein
VHRHKGVSREVNRSTGYGEMTTVGGVTGP